MLLPPQERFGCLLLRLQISRLAATSIWKCSPLDGKTTVAKRKPSHQHLNVQVYVPVKRRPSSDNVLAEQTRPLHVKLEGFMDVLLYYMKDEWGGHDLTSCSAEMLAAARKFSGDPNL
jgi:hypothetical protein